jgi:hypothetical protein
MLTLQLIRVMDQLWQVPRSPPTPPHAQENGLFLQMSAYDCLATGDEVGMLEMVMGSATLWKIQGGTLVCPFSCFRQGWQRAVG